MTSLPTLVVPWFLLLSASPQSPEAPPWGVGVFAGQETGNRNRIYGNAYGAELSIQFLRSHWIQGRARATLFLLGEGPAGRGEPGTSATFGVLSCDWIFRFTKAHGPYLLLGAGLNRHQLDTHPTTTDASSGNGGGLAFAAGLGYLHRNRYEIEARQDFMDVNFFSERRNATSLVLLFRIRF